MKKFLSVILALAMLVAPIGVMSSFADGGKYAEAFSDLDNAILEAVSISAFLNEHGRYNVSFDFFSQGEQFLRTIDAPEGMNFELIDDVLEKFKVKEEMIKTGSSKALIMVKIQVGGRSRVVIYLFNFKDNFIDCIVGTYNLNGRYE